MKIEQVKIDSNVPPENLKGIFLTHAHPDHIGTANHFRTKYGCKVYASEGEKRCLEKHRGIKKSAEILTRTTEYTMKKIIVTAAVFGLAMAFTACGDDSSSNPGPNTDTNGPNMDKDNQTKGEACLISYSDGTKRCNTSEVSMMLCGGTGSTDGVSFTTEAVANCPAGENLKCVDTDGSLSYFYDETMTECPSWLKPAE